MQCASEVSHTTLSVCGPLAVAAATVDWNVECETEVDDQEHNDGFQYKLISWSLLFMIPLCHAISSTGKIHCYNIYAQPTVQSIQLFFCSTRYQWLMGDTKQRGMESLTNTRTRDQHRKLFKSKWPRPLDLYGTMPPDEGYYDTLLIIVSI